MQEKGELSLDKVSHFFPGKSVISIKRSMANINYYLPENKKMFMDDAVIHANLNYKNYIQFIHHIKLKDYFSSTTERLQLIILCAFIFETVNTSRLYESIGVSLSTKKKDIRELKQYLIDYNLDIEVINGKGIRLTGDESSFRILLLNIIFSICELNRNHSLSPRVANNPYQRLMYQYIDDCFNSESELLANHFNALLQSKNIHLSYAGKKILYIYMMIAGQRTKAYTYIDKTLELPFSDSHNHTSEHDHETIFLNRFITSLDHDNYSYDITDWHLGHQVNMFVQHIQKKIITRIINHQKLTEELYVYIYKSLIRRFYRYDLFDNNLQSTYENYTNLFTLVQENIKEIESEYSVAFSHNQLAAITLIIRKHIINNKMIGRNPKNIIIVTNSAIEKINFFMTHLSSHVEIGVCKTVNINEIEKVQDLQYHFIITFSNRIAMLLNEISLENIKLNYHLQSSDIDRLISLGFSSNLNRKIDAQQFCETLPEMTIEQLKIWLLEQYPRHFI